jgi:serine/threonine protein kinase
LLFVPVAADFGLAWELLAHEQQRRASVLGLRGTIGGNAGQTSAGGTPFYMAPEIVAALLANRVLSATRKHLTVLHHRSFQAHAACHTVAEQHGQLLISSSCVNAVGKALTQFVMLASKPLRPTAASDIWALGVILWEVAYLSHPFFTTQREWWQVVHHTKL